jgi:predicted glycogen debranching enzyme
LFYRKELERGYTPTDDLFIGARLELAVRKPITFFAVCAADFSEKRAADLCKKLLSVPSAYADHENLRKEALVKSFSKSTGLKVTRGMRELVESSDDFIVSRAGRTAVIAGYPFFGEWGRDSLISLPGLCLATGRKREAEDILLSLMSESQKGIVPNSFASGKSFNSIDATLWMFWAVWKYLEYTGDYGFIEDRIWPGLKKMMRHYVPMVGQDALIRSESTAPATWMDAVVDGTPVTPRNGSPVEIQALWYNALMVCSKLVERFGEDVVPYLNMAEACKKSFNSRFVNKESGYLYDVVDGERRDASVRPNALFAISLDFPVLDRKCWKQVVDTAKRELLTPYGLRTLSRQDPNYKGFASGNQSERDRAYHQGDAWPWLLGAFADAYLKVYPDGRIGDFIRPLLEGRNSACAGKVPEIYDGSEPQKPAGCISQAWSCAELIRLLSEHSDRV